MGFFVMLIVAPRRKKVNASHFRPHSLQDRRERINAPPQSYNRGMGLASWLVLRQQCRLRAALPVYGVQLFFNFFWPLLFFRWGLFLPALFSWRRCGD